MDKFLRVSATLGLTAVGLGGFGALAFVALREKARIEAVLAKKTIIDIPRQENLFEQIQKRIDAVSYESDKNESFENDDILLHSGPTGKVIKIEDCEVVYLPNESSIFGLSHSKGWVLRKRNSESNQEPKPESKKVEPEDVSSTGSDNFTHQIVKVIDETDQGKGSNVDSIIEENSMAILEDKDSANVVDVKVAFSNDNKEKVLDPKMDFSGLNINSGDNSTLNGLSKSCMDLGIVLGELMADVPDVAQPRLIQVYTDLKTLFQNVLNLQKEQDDLISKALQEQGSEFSQVLEHQWESSVDAMASHVLELEKDYSEKLNEFKTLYTNQILQEEQLKLENIRKEFETEKSNALLSQEQELKNSWEAVIEEKLDQERDGRLAKLDYLTVKVQVLQNVTEDIGSRLEEKYKLQNIDFALENLKRAVSNSPRYIEKEFERLWLAGSKYPFISTILSSLPKDLAVVGVPEYNDLLNSFLKLGNDISKIRFMPENGGVISYLISSFGPRSPIGEITENVLEKSYESMSRGDIDSATRQLNRLRGWQRILALDWLSEARRYLELMQALEVIHDYVRLEKLEVL